MSKNWQSLLRVEQNEKKLFHFLPPTQAGFKQHILKRAIYQGVLIWGQTLLEKHDEQQAGKMRIDGERKHVESIVNYSFSSGCQKGCKER